MFDKLSRFEPLGPPFKGPDYPVVIFSGEFALPVMNYVFEHFMTESTNLRARNILENATELLKLIAGTHLGKTSESWRSWKVE